MIQVNKFRRDSAAFSSSLINKYTHQKKVLELLSQGLVTDEFAGATLATIAKADEVPECQRLVDECGQVETILHKAGEFTLWRFIKEHKWAFVVLLLGVVLVAVPGAQFFLIPEGMEVLVTSTALLNLAYFVFFLDRPCHCWRTWRGNRHSCCYGTLNFPQVREAGIHRDV
jgi:hypothetical protein